MRKLSLLFILIAIITLFGSCKKDSNPDPIVTASRLKSYTEDLSFGSSGHQVVTWNVSYDAQDRITSLISAPSPGDKFILAYPSDNRYTLDIFGSNALTIHEDFFLNGQLSLDSTYQYNDTDDKSTEKYIYNVNNQLVTKKEYDYSTGSGSELSNTTTYVYDANGNLSRDFDTDKQVETYEYYTDLSYIAPLILGPVNSNTTKKYNLLKKQTVTSNGYPVGTVDHTYTFDSNNRISTDKAVGDDGTIAIKTYTYL